MSSSLLPPAAEETARPFEVSDARINTTSLVLGGYVLFLIYPAYALSGQAPLRAARCSGRRRTVGN